jgi:heme-degrading monooxygenase HmoA
MIRIHVRRNIPADKKEDAMRLIIKLRSMSMGQPGYISGETLKRFDKPGESLVVTKWQSIHYWNQWFKSEERSEIQDKIDQLLGEETQYEMYEYDPIPM